MGTTISATEAVRNFSELLNNIKYRGERYTVLRGGKPAAALVPAGEAAPERLLRELPGIFRILPRLDRDDENFAEDVLAVAGLQPSLPEDLGWE